uniref:Uncharacterized protein n=1 Tax=Eutreptiella gymnastica TaxID=73025 RepID=A0A7S4LFG2_9EUGL
MGGVKHALERGREGGRAEKNHYYSDHYNTRRKKARLKGAQTKREDGEGILAGNPPYAASANHVKRHRPGAFIWGRDCNCVVLEVCISNPTGAYVDSNLLLCVARFVFFWQPRPHENFVWWIL